MRTVTKRPLSDINSFLSLGLWVHYPQTTWNGAQHAIRRTPLNNEKQNLHHHEALSSLHANKMPLLSLSTFRKAPDMTLVAATAS